MRKKVSLSLLVFCMCIILPTASVAADRSAADPLLLLDSNITMLQNLLEGIPGDDTARLQELFEEIRLITVYDACGDSGCVIDLPARVGPYADNGTSSIIPTECLGSLLSVGVNLVSLVKELANTSLTTCGVLFLTENMSTVAQSYISFRICTIDYSANPDEVLRQQLETRLTLLTNLNLVLSFLESALGCQ